MISNNIAFDIKNNCYASDVVFKGYFALVNLGGDRNAVVQGVVDDILRRASAAAQNDERAVVVNVKDLYEENDRQQEGKAPRWTPFIGAGYAGLMRYFGKGGWDVVCDENRTNINITWKAGDSILDPKPKDQKG